MPYIKDENNRRGELNNGLAALTAGELNYQIFTYIKYSHLNERAIDLNTIRKYMSEFLISSGLPNYQRYNDLSGCIVCCYRELHRRLSLDAHYLFDLLDEYNEEIDVYEDKKILENKDV